jgi:hypothetical protein
LPRPCLRSRSLPKLRNPCLGALYFGFYILARCCALLRTLVRCWVASCGVSIRGSFGFNFFGLSRVKAVFRFSFYYLALARGAASI